MHFIQRWQRLNRRQQLAVFVVGGALGLWLIDTAMLKPLRHHLRRVHRQVQETEQRLLEALVADGQAESVQQAFGAYGPYVRPAGSPEAELAGLLSEVESAVRASGMVLLNLKPVTLRQSESHIIGVTLESEATTGQLVQFLDTVQRSTRLLKVTELTVRVSDDQTLRTSCVVSKLLLK